ncbi:ABC transporter ATP-binding protein [Fulvivirga sedimenti]|uniref:ATP-binding cassette domain-containing protein n=1 Tax=Fulvivirga sedimenti TaxID=2879465 RepID=A0A9X1KX46_9BACT|nr:ATP-binding cassette domain-containing protein [Fulvivirga sedimenti]MCA6073877.1 ATP-binding cassette domain-containing protein [Fulvivirga sedimenti]
MDIRISGLSKRFNREWLFSGMDHSFSEGDSYAITGANGSGKSTFLQIIAGFQLPSEGTVEWFENNIPVPAETVYQRIAIAAPYMELVEEFTLKEMLSFHFSFKSVRNGYSIQDLIDIGYFTDTVNKPVRNFSSGMKQRLKILLALYTDVPLVFLDEPTTNMDEYGTKWYLQQVETLNIPTILVASNQPHEYTFCNKKLIISDYKPANK